MKSESNKVVLEISHEVLPLYFPIIASHVGHAYAASGRGNDALTLLEQAVAQTTAMGMPWVLARLVAYLSEAALVTGRLEEATVHARRALDLSRTHKERGTEAWALRLLGDIAARREPAESEPAEAFYQQALTLAEELGMRPLVAHCHLGLGTLYRQIGRLAEARTALSTAIDLYRTMEMSLWLHQAEAAFGSLRESQPDQEPPRG